MTAIIVIMTLTRVVIVMIVIIMDHHGKNDGEGLSWIMMMIIHKNS
jgi:hypothetical protein